MDRIEAGLGYRISREIMLKLVYQYYNRPQAALGGLGITQVAALQPAHGFLGISFSAVFQALPVQPQADLRTHSAASSTLTISPGSIGSRPQR